jgi:hypothetical protein
MQTNSKELALVSPVICYREHVLPGPYRIVFALIQ